jgi:hypothetical protein
MDDPPAAAGCITYEIKVTGRLDDRWSDWFSGLKVTETYENHSESVTTLVGTLDQAALRGVADRIWDLNLVLVSIIPIEEVI